MDIATADKLLTTTRAVRKRLDFTRPIEPAIIEECLEVAVQAPAGGNVAKYHFLVITDPEKGRRLGDLYRSAFPQLFPNDVRAQRREKQPRFMESAEFLEAHVHKAPAHVIPCVEYPLNHGYKENALASISMVSWSLMLALRARGIGTSWTTLTVMYCREEMIEMFSIPEHIQPAGLIPVAYYTGDDFKPARRIPAAERTHWNTW